MVLRDYIKSANRWQIWGKNYHDKAGKYYLETSKGSLTIATFLLSFIGVFLEVNKTGIISCIDKALLGAGFILLTCSVVLGIYSLTELNKFLNHAGDYYESLSENLNRWMLKKHKTKGKTYPKEIFKGLKFERESGNKLAYLQLYTLGAGFLCIATYFFLLLF